MLECRSNALTLPSSLRLLRRAMRTCEPDRTAVCRTDKGLHADDDGMRKSATRSRRRGTLIQDTSAVAGECQRLHAARTGAFATASSARRPSAPTLACQPEGSSSRGTDDAPLADLVLLQRANLSLVHLGLVLVREVGDVAVELARRVMRRMRGARRAGKADQQVIWASRAVCILHSDSRHGWRWLGGVSSSNPRLDPLPSSTTAALAERPWLARIRQNS